MTATVIACTHDAPWLPAGGRADVVLDPEGRAPHPTGLVRLLIRRGGTVFCVLREGSEKLDLPTRTVTGSDDGRAAVKRLVAAVLGHRAPATLLGYVRNTVEAPDDAYPWPTPVAHFCVWEVAGDPSCDGTWLPVDDPASPLRDRHWWPLLGAHPSRATPAAAVAAPTVPE